MELSNLFAFTKYLGLIYEILVLGHDFVINVAKRYIVKCHRECQTPKVITKVKIIQHGYEKKKSVW